MIETVQVPETNCFAVIRTDPFDNFLTQPDRVLNNHHVLSFRSEHPKIFRTPIHLTDAVKTLTFLMSLCLPEVVGASSR